MNRWIIAILFVVCFGKTQAQALQAIRSWTFSLEHGSLRIDMKSSSDGMISLGLGPNGKIPEAPISEQIGPLKKVLTEMLSLGLDPHKITYLGTRIFTQDVLEKLAYMCADSQTWRSTMRDKGKDKERILISLLNESKVYEPYNEAFNLYEIQVRVTDAEKVGLMRFSQVPPRDARDRSSARLLVPADAMLGMRFSRLDSHGAKK
jgi:hypothetical protein